MYWRSPSHISYRLQQMTNIPNERPTKRRSRRSVIFLIACAIVIATGWWAIPHLFRESKTIRNLDINMGTQDAHVTVIQSQTRVLLSYPHGNLIGGGNLRYDTTVTFTSGRKLEFQTTIQPRAIWSVGDRVFVICCGIGGWLTAEIRDGQVMPMARSALPVLPPSWNLQPTDIQSEWWQEYNQLEH